MLLTAGSCVLGALSLTTMWLALGKRQLLAAWCLALIQPPNMAYDVATHQYGWVALGAATAVMAISKIRSMR